MKDRPYVPWYHGEFLRRTAGWMPMERFTYMMLLCAQWEIGPLPADPARLASIVGIDTSTFASIWPVVSEKFVCTSDGLIDEHMEDRRAKYLDFQRKQSDGGKKGAAIRWSKSAGNVVSFPKSEGDANG